MSTRMFATLAALALLAAAPAMVAAACSRQKDAKAADPISGEWEVTLEIAGASAQATFDLKLEGDKVTGTADSQHTGPGRVRDGSFKDGALKFTLDFDKHESIALTGAAKDGQLSGEFATEGMTGKWRAKRKG
jgi:hypothetical protein